MRKNLVVKGGFIVVATVAFSGVGVAYAAWSASGTGQSVAATKAKAKQDLTVTASTVAADLIYPTATFTQPINVTNPNPYKVELASVSVTGATAPGACGTALAALSTTPFSGSLTGLTDEVARDNGATVTKNVTVTVANTIPDSCADQNITLTVAAAGASK